MLAALPQERTYVSIGCVNTGIRLILLQLPANQSQIGNTTSEHNTWWEFALWFIIVCILSCNSCYIRCFIHCMFVTPWEPYACCGLVMFLYFDKAPVYTCVSCFIVGPVLGVSFCGRFVSHCASMYTSTKKDRRWSGGCMGVVMWGWGLVGFHLRSFIQFRKSSGTYNLGNPVVHIMWEIQWYILFGRSSGAFHVGNSMVHIIWKIV